MFAGLKMKLISGAKNAAVKLSKVSPELGMIFGGAAIIAGFVMIAKAAPRIAKTTEGFNLVLDDIRQKAEEKGLTKKETQKLVRKETANYVMEVVKLAGPAVGIELLGLVGMGVGFGVLKARSVKCVAMLNALNTTFNKYRSRVREEEGEDRDLYFLTGVKKEKVLETIENEDGTTEQVEVTKFVKSDKDGPDEGITYGRFFDEVNNPRNQWTKSPIHNAYILRVFRARLQEILDTRGYLFLNEAYEMIGYEPTWYGGMVGWLREGVINGVRVSGRVDFRCPDIDSVNPKERSYFLDFNVDGVITDHLRLLDRARIAAYKAQERQMQNALKKVTV